MSFSIQSTCPIVPDTSDKLFFFLLADNKGVYKREKETEGECEEEDWTRPSTGRPQRRSALLFVLYRELSLNTWGSSDKRPLGTIDNVPSARLSFAAVKQERLNNQEIVDNWQTLSQIFWSPRDTLHSGSTAWDEHQKHIRGKYEHVFANLRGSSDG